MKKRICMMMLCAAVLLAGCGQNNTPERNAEIESEQEKETAIMETEKEAEVSEMVETSETSEKAENAENTGIEETDEYVALESNGTGFVTESFSNITYSIPDTWYKKESNGIIWYKDKEATGLLYIRATPFEDIDDIEIQNMLVDAPIEAIKKIDGFSEWATEELVMDYGNKAVMMLYSYTEGMKLYESEAFIINDLEAVVTITYTTSGEAANENLKLVLNDIFATVELANQP